LLTHPFPEWRDFAKKGAVALTCVALSVMFCTNASALNPDWQIYQFGHRAWKIDDGYLGGYVNAIAQGGGGYLWVGTDKGLFRFDGVRFRQWNPPGGSRPPSLVSALLGDKDDGLWIGTNDGVIHWNGQSVTRYKENQGAFVHSMSKGHDGTVWFTFVQLKGENEDTLCGVTREKMACYGKKDGIDVATASGPPLLSVAADSSGSTWLGTPQSLVEWKDGSAKVYALDSLRNNAQQIGISTLAVDADGSILAGTMKTGPGLGLQRFRDGKWSTVAAPGFDGSQHKILRVFVDSHQAVWVGTYDDGIYRLYQGRADHFEGKNGLSGNGVVSIFEDGESSLWVGTMAGLDQFYQRAVQGFSKMVYPKASEFDNLVTLPDGTLWIGGDGSLHSLRNGTNTFVPMPGNLTGKQVTTIFGDRAGHTWIGVEDTLNLYVDGKFRLVTMPNGRSTGMIVSMAEDIEGNLWALTLGPPRTILQVNAKTLQASALPDVVDASKIAMDPKGGLWIGSNAGGLLHFSKGKLTSVSFVPEFDSRIAQLSVMPGGEVLGASESGLGYLNGRTVQLLGIRNGLPCSDINNFVFDGKGDLWLYAQCGLIEVSQPEFERWRNNPSSRIQLTVFDSSDGIRPHFPPFEGAARSGDGRLWFNGMDSLQMVDPEHLHRNTTPPPVHIEGLRADFQDHALAETVELPPLTRDIEISYSALSFVAPQKILYRYRLLGFDQDWHDVGARQQAVYMNLKPRTYTFEVVASNNDGVWNSTGDTLRFTILPKFYQTAWFRVAGVAAFAVVLWALYQLRLHQLRRQFDLGLEQRVGERTRIARELHDTLLQSLHGLMFQFQAARNMLPRSPENAERALDDAISGTEQAIDESRDAIHDLRSEPLAEGDLAQLLESASEEFSTVQGTNQKLPAFHVIVEGEPRTLSPAFQNEVYRIARELIRNAFRHAAATQIEAEIRYDGNGFRLRLRDDGKGMDPNVLEQTRRPGHWGLPGIRERAQRISAQLDFWSQEGAGTEVELAAPAAIAYEQAGGQSQFKLFRKDKS
jgi:signal transduction histidine kinase/ligand-binding sensor domain-containing protein